MPRKKPFSSKQKKKQLQDRRRKKQDGGHDSAESSGAESDKEDKEEEQDEAKASVAKINQQPTKNLPSGKYDPNRYRLHFFQESKEELRKRKELAYQPYKYAPQESLEMTVDLSEESIIDFPKRPAWNYSLSKQQLEASEEKYFKSYIDDLFSSHGPHELSYFELNLETWRQLWRVLEISDMFLLITDIRHPIFHCLGSVWLNLETWRQLWRVLEMSDMFLLITDIRHPLLHFSPALYQYITKDLQKEVVLVLNKVDLAPPGLVVAWQQLFREKFPLLKTVCFTSFPKSRSELENITGKIAKVVFKKRRRGTYRAMGPRELYKICDSIVRDEVDLSSWASKIESDQAVGYHSDTDDDEEVEEEVQVTKGQGEVADCSYHKHEKYKEGILTIGCIGYPNVGKSSVMNGLMGKKVVSVSKTPGHTKHFQTIFLTSTVRMCDSPGLVFPSRRDKHLQILGGLFPIAQLRDPYSTVAYLAERMDLPKLLQIKPLDDERNFKWTAIEICDSWAEKRGFLTAKAARPDTYRAANNLLRLAVEGRICLCHTPPGYFSRKDQFEIDSETKDFIELQHKYRLGDKNEEESSSEREGSDSGREGTGDSEGESDETGEAIGGSESTTASRQRGVKVNNPFALLADSD